MKFYCPGCFKATEYSLSKPETCPHCKKSTKPIVAAAKPPIGGKKITRQEALRALAESEDDSEVIDFNPNVFAGFVKASVGYGGGETLGDVGFQEKTGFVDNSPNKPYTIEDFRREAAGQATPITLGDPGE